MTRWGRNTQLYEYFIKLRSIFTLFSPYFIVEHNGIYNFEIKVVFKFHRRHKSKGFKSGEGVCHAVGPPRPIYCSRSALLNYSRTARRSCGGAPFWMNHKRILVCRSTPCRFSRVFSFILCTLYIYITYVCVFVYVLSFLSYKVLEGISKEAQQRISIASNAVNLLK
jgi:hypothetical protein